MADAMSAATQTVAIALSTYQGGHFVVPQLHSFLGQTYRDWVLYWRDDGSTDGTKAAMHGFLRQLPADRYVVLDDNERLGATESYLRLLRRVHRDGRTLLAFADQDDVWLPEKLTRAVSHLAAVPPPTPALYFARQVLVDAGLHRIALSFAPRRSPGFPTCLTQNIATGCTVMMNRSALDLVAMSEAPEGTLHDWWSYIVVAAHGGQLLSDREPTVLYRQHATNAVGAPPTLFRRGIAAIRRGPGPFMRLLRGSVAALSQDAERLPEDIRRQLAIVAAGLAGGPRERLTALALPEFRRQTMLETLLFRLWFMMDRPA